MKEYSVELEVTGKVKMKIKGETFDEIKDKISFASNCRFYSSSDDVVVESFDWEFEECREMLLDEIRQIFEYGSPQVSTDKLKRIEEILKED